MWCDVIRVCICWLESVREYVVWYVYDLLEYVRGYNNYVYEL